MIFDVWQKIWSNKRIRVSVLATTVMMLVTHAYAYFNSTFLHDRTVYFMEPAFESAMRTKWMAQFIDLLTSFGYLPWLFGILCIFFMAISVYIIISVLDVRKCLSVYIIAGLCATNSSIIGAHFYWPFEILAALPFACLSVWIWDKSKMNIWLRVVFETGFIALSLGTYGAYTSVGPTLVIVACIQLILQGRKVGDVLKRGLEYVVSFVCGGIAYYLILRVFLKVQHLSVYSYLNEDKLTTGVSIGELWNYTVTAYNNSIDQYLGNFYAMMSQWMAVSFLLFGLLLFIYQLYINRNNIKNKGTFFLLLVLIFLFPLASGLINILSFGNVHFLMVFTYVVFYIGLVKLAEQGFETEKPEKPGIWHGMRLLSTGLVLLLIAFVYRGVLVANMSYMRLENIYRISESIGTRILAKIEMTEGFSGRETIVFDGDFHTSEYLSENNSEDAEYLSILDKMSLANRHVPNSFSYNGPMYSFMKDVLGCSMPMRSYDSTLFSAEHNNEIKSMPVYPNNGSIKKIDNTIVVKLQP